VKPSLGTSFRRRLIVLIGLGALLFTGLIVNARDFIRLLDDRLLEQRMAFAPRGATGNHAFIAIDKASLDRIGVWPWPRSLYGNILKALTDAGVKDIAFDIDFSTPSSPDQDQAFAKALEEAGGGVLLASFLQHSGADRSGGELTLTTPIPLLSDNAWVGAVNVVPDADGVLRTIPYAVPTPDGPLPSLPVLLAHRDENRTDSFLIDFSIRPETVPVYPVADLLDGKVPPNRLAGKSVLIGAYAVELKDYFTVPVLGTIPGPLVQILATETLVQGRVAPPVDIALIVASASASLAFFFLVRPRRLWAQFLLLAAIGLAFEAVAYWLFRQEAVWLRTAGVHLALVIVALGRVIVELDVRRLLLRIAALETRNTKQILEQVITDNSDAILIADDAGKIVELSVRVQDVFRPRPGVGPGSDMAEVLPPRLVSEARAALDAMRRGAPPAAAVHETFLQDGGEERCVEYSITPSRLETADGESFVVCIAARDITERRRQEAALDHLSRFDELTGAMRQSEFVARLDRLLAAGEPAVAVYSLNLHRFKTINTTLGRDVGDRLLATVVRTLEDFDPGIVLVGRTGSDSFCLARVGHGEPEAAAAFAESLIRMMGVPFTLGENRAKIGVHIGMAIGQPGSGVDGATLLDNAEFALDQAREINGSGWTSFDPAASEKITASRKTERELWRALEKEEIFVTYQPQVTLSDRELIGAEALVRWKHPSLGMISPAEFVEIAEANGFVEKLGQWVLERACADAMTWEKPINLAVNVSALQFSRGDVVSDVKQALAQSGLPAHRLHLEITESIFLDKSGQLVEKLKALKALGISLALDDFGTGYSSFGYIAHFPPDKIKVDQLFIRTLDESHANRTILRSVRSLCEGLGVLMVCEGVETESQLAFLKELGCEEGQGWLFGRPQPNETMREMTRLAADAQPA
jgi:diguanylate cyclase (GGDEF)-like protein/PAS domain S-box-containing protein